MRSEKPLVKVLRMQARNKIRVCPACLGNNAECGHCGGSGAIDGRETLNIIGAKSPVTEPVKLDRPVYQRLDKINLMESDAPGAPGRAQRHANQTFNKESSKPKRNSGQTEVRFNLVRRFLNWMNTFFGIKK